MSAPDPTLIYRLVHVDSLKTIVSRGILHAPNTTPDDGLPYRTIHNVRVQQNRKIKRVSCGPGGSVHDYVPFYFGRLSVMLLNLHGGRVEGYREGQQPLVYLVTTVQDVVRVGCRFVFTDGHGLAKFTCWFTELADLSYVDWEVVNVRYWRDTEEEPDRKRRKQAEFLIWQECDWRLIREIGVLDAAAGTRVEALLDLFPDRHRPAIVARPEWYY